MEKRVSKITQLQSFYRTSTKSDLSDVMFLNQLLGKSHGIGFIDSTKISVCDNRRIHSHKLFKPFAQRGKTSTGWFYGFKLHMVINHLGEMTALKLTASNQHDTAVIQELLTNHQGIVVGDKGYLS